MFESSGSRIFRLYSNPSYNLKVELEIKKGSSSFV
jgi:hypothetical protein